MHSFPLNPLGRVFRTRILLVGLVFVGAIALGGAFELHRAKESLMHESSIQAEVKSQVFAEYSSSIIKRVDELLLDTRDSWQADQLADEIRSKQEYTQDLTFQMAVIDTDGIMVFSNLQKSKERVDLSQREHFKIHKNNPTVDRLYISNPLLGKVSGKWSIQFSRPIFKDKQFAGVLVASVSPTNFSDFAKSLGLNEDDVVSMVRDSGEIMARYPVRNDLLNKKLTMAPYLKPNAPISGTYKKISESDGVDRIFGYYKKPELGMNFTIGQDSSRILAVYQDYARMISGAMLLISLTILGLMFSLLRVLKRSEELQRNLEIETINAQEASVSKSNFLANMSHEIRTPLNAIFGMLNLLQKTEQSNNQADYTNKAKHATQSLMALINDILDFSKIDAGKMDLDLQTLRLDKLLRDLAVVLSATVGSKNIEIMYDIDMDAPQNLFGDAMRLQQVLINLGGNAVKFTSTGQVVVGVKMLGFKNDGHVSAEIEFSVTDSGIGIAEEHQERIFGGFSQAEASTTRRYGGTGLGLSISRKLVNLMGGEIQLISEVNKGSRFSFAIELPVSEDVTQEATPFRISMQNKHEAKEHRVLLVDDNTISSNILKKTMSSFGWKVDVFNNGVDALVSINSLARSQAFPYDTVYVDWQMPDFDGWVTIQKLRDLASEFVARTYPTKYVMLSANGRENLTTRTEEEQNWLNAFLVKPVTPSMIFDASLFQAEDHPSLRTSQANSKRRLAGMRILVVEDNAINQQVAEELLSSEGALVSIASDGALGLAAVESASPQFDAILMDIQMPVMDGYTATKNIRTKLGLINLPIIGLTANAMASDRYECLSVGMTEHMGKPFDLDQLVTLLLGLTQYKPSETLEDFLPFRDQPSFHIEHGPVKFVVDDLDLTSALTRIGNNKKLYVRLAKELSKTLTSVDADIKKHIDAGDQKSIQTTLHTFKGVSGTLGLTQLSEEFKRLELMIKGTTNMHMIIGEMPSLNEKIMKGKNALDEAISTMECNQVVTEKVATVDIKPLQDLIRNKIVPLLKASDLSVLEVFSNYRSELESLPADFFSQLEEPMQALDLELALSVCDKILTV